MFIKEKNRFIYYAFSKEDKKLFIILYYKTFSIALKIIEMNDSYLFNTYSYYELLNDELNIKTFLSLNQNIYVININLSNTDLIFDVFNNSLSSTNSDIKKESYQEIKKKINENMTSNISVYNNIINSKTSSFAYFKEKNIIIVGQENGLVNIFSYSTSELILMYQIKAHFHSVNNIIPLSYSTNESKTIVSFISSSLDQTIKYWSTENCWSLNVRFYKKDFNFIINTQKTELERLCSKLNSLLFFHQSNEKANNFLKNLNDYYINKDLKFDENQKVDENNCEIFLFSYYKTYKENIMSCIAILNLCLNMEHLKDENNKFQQVINQFKSKLILATETQKSEEIDLEENKKEENKKDENTDNNSKDDESLMIAKKSYIAYILNLKMKEYNIENYIDSLEKIKTSLFINQVQIFFKINKIIEIIKSVSHV